MTYFDEDVDPPLSKRNVVGTAFACLCVAFVAGLAWWLS